MLQRANDEPLNGGDTVSFAGAVNKQGTKKRIKSKKKKKKWRNEFTIRPPVLLPWRAIQELNTNKVKTTANARAPSSPPPFPGLITVMH